MSGKREDFLAQDMTKSMHNFGDGSPPVALPHFDERRLDQILSGAPLASSLLHFFRARPVTPLRQRIGEPGDREIISMPIISHPYSGVKLLTVVPENTGTPRPVISGLFTLLDMQTGSVLATMDAGALTVWRTAGLAAAAASRLARPDARVLTLIGSGHIIPYLGAMHAATRPIEKILLWARRPDAAKEAADRVRQIVGPDSVISVEVRPDLESAVREADIVSAATRSRDPLIKGDWLSPGAHVDLVGGYRPDMREIDDAGVARASLYVDDRVAALSEAGDLMIPIDNGVIDAADVRGDFADLALCENARSTPEEITLFKSVGVAASDLAIAILAWERDAADCS
jgi:ornithine cyclodeaminase/alanine dehydrogenase-like protein (mu-crystallin family)